MVMLKNKSASESLIISNSSKKRFTQNIRWQYVANGSQALLGGAYLIVLGRLLGSAEFGVFSAVMALISVTSLLTDMRLQEVVARDFCHLDDDKLRKSPSSLHLIDLFTLDIICRILPALTVVLFSNFFASCINLEQEYRSVLSLVAIGFAFSRSGSSVSTGLLRVLGRTDLIAFCIVTDWGLRLVVTSLIALSWHLNVALTLGIMIAISILCNGVLNWLAYREFTLRIGPINIFGWSISGATKRLYNTRRLIMSNLGVSVSELMAKELDVVILATILIPEKVGLYKMAKSMVQLIWRAIDPFYITIMPEIQRLWQLKYYEEAYILIRKTGIRLLVLATTLVVIVNILIKQLGVQVLGVEYSNINELTEIMSLWLMVASPLIWGPALAIAIGRPELNVVGGMFGQLIGFFAFILITPIFGLIGAGIAWNLTLISGFVFIAVVTLKYAKSSY